MPCPDSVQTQAYFDGEVDSLSAARIESHMADCADCRALLQELQQLRASLRREVRLESAPPALRERIARTLEQENPSPSIASPKRASATHANASLASSSQAGPSQVNPTRPGPSPAGASRTGPFTSRPWRGRSFWSGIATGVSGAALAAGLAFFVMMPPRTDPVLDDLVGAHLRSLLPSHLIDVVSTDQHTVKPWFAGRADVSPAVADFEAQGYRLAGGRVDYLEHQRAAVLVYQHGAHTLNVFSWSAGQRPLPSDTTRNGYHLAFWQAGNLVYCTVSDASWASILELKRLLQDLSARDNRE